MVGLVQSNHTFPYLNRASYQHYNFLFLVRKFFFLKYDFHNSVKISHHYTGTCNCIYSLVLGYIFLWYLKSERRKTELLGIMYVSDFIWHSLGLLQSLLQTLFTHSDRLTKKIKSGKNVPQDHWFFNVSIFKEKL